VTKSFNTLNPGEKYEDNWHIWAITHHLELCQKGEIKRLLITLPPRSLKSHIVSTSFPAFLLGHNPSSKIICASYSQTLAEDFSNQCRILMAESWYKTIFPRTVLSSTKNTASEFSTTQLGQRIATSSGGTLTGRGGMFIIVDDINKATDYTSEANRVAANKWFDNTLQSRLDNMNKGCIIVVQQRVHDNDLSGHILKKGGWVHLNLPAIAPEGMKISIGTKKFFNFKAGKVLHPERYSQETLDQIKQDIGSYLFAAQYLQSPVPEKGNIIPVELFKSFEIAPIQQKGDLVVNVWDIASGQAEHNDYSVGTIWLYRFNQYYLLDIVRRKISYNELRLAVIYQASESRANLIVIEKAGVGIALIDDLRKCTSFNVIDPIPTQDKVTRMMPGTAEIEAGKVALPKDALWRADFERECASFPHGKHDDQVDSLSMFLNWAREHSHNDERHEILIQTLELMKHPTELTMLRTKEDIKKMFRSKFNRRGINHGKIT
jgi:predicted phage terminase large subunit-like protein